MNVARPIPWVDSPVRSRGLTAEDAVQYGIVDEILQPSKAGNLALIGGGH